MMEKLGKLYQKHGSSLREPSTQFSYISHNGVRALVKNDRKSIGFPPINKESAFN